jgi:hypothetical protein
MTLFLFSCDNGLDSYMLTTKITGTVTDKETGEPLDSVNVYIFCKEFTGMGGGNIHYNTYDLSRTTTNELGFYELSESIMESENYYLGANRKGYQGIYNFSYNVPRVDYKSSQRIDIQLKKQ